MKFMLSVAQLALNLTFVLGAGVGMWLSGMQPPRGAGLPMPGWSGTGGELRVARFIGIHAAQVLPVLGFALAHWRPFAALPRRRATVWRLRYGRGCGHWRWRRRLSGRPLIALQLRLARRAKRVAD